MKESKEHPMNKHMTVSSHPLLQKGGLLISFLALLCLLLSPAPGTLIRNTIVLLVLAIVVILGQCPVSLPQLRSANTLSILAALIACMVSLQIFCTTWTTSAKATALAAQLGITHNTLVICIGLFGAVVSFYATKQLAEGLFAWIVDAIKQALPVHSLREMLTNLKSNWFLVISAAAFACLTAQPMRRYVVGVGVTVLAVLLLSTQLPSLWQYAKRTPLWRHLVAAATAIGICWSSKALFYSNWAWYFDAHPHLVAHFPAGVHAATLLALCGAVVAFYFTYYCVLAFWNTLIRVISEAKIFRGIGFGEWMTYCILFGITLGLMIAIFLHTNTFYDTPIKYDIIYTSDTSALVSSNVYLTLTNPENDLRQPLFAVFASPFAGIPYLITKVFGLSSTLHAILTNSVQIGLLFAANLMLAKLIANTATKRICVMVLLCCTYTQLLFTLMMEQYIVAYFWLMLCFSLILKSPRPSRMALWGAGGTLLTSMILLPLMPKKHPLKQFKEWVSDCVKVGLSFVAIMLVFNRFDVFASLSDKVTALNRFTGKNLTMVDKLEQYSHFVKTCFVAPPATVTPDIHGQMTWKLLEQNSFCIIGLILIGLALFGALLNIKNPTTLLALAWTGFSVVMLVILGWGTKENGLNLYALYFGWAFFVLIYQLVDKMAEVAHFKALVPLATLTTAALLLLINMQGMSELLQFAFTYYPI